MEISGKVVFHAGAARHNQATLEGVKVLADILAGGGYYKQITNCFLITAAAAAEITAAPIDLTWELLRDYLVGNTLYASIGTADDEHPFGSMTVMAEGISTQDGAAKLVNTVYFPANGNPAAKPATVFYLVLVAGGNIAPYSATGYTPIGSEAVLAVVDMQATPINFTPQTDNNFTWTLYFRPVTR